MDNPSNWRGDQDLVDLDSWRRAGLGEFEEEETVGVEQRKSAENSPIDEKESNRVRIALPVLS